jgi:hypothetical protein
MSILRQHLKRRLLQAGEFAQLAATRREDRVDSHDLPPTQQDVNSCNWSPEEYLGISSSWMAGCAESATPLVVCFAPCVARLLPDRDMSNPTANDHRPLAAMALCGADSKSYLLGPQGQSEITHRPIAGNCKNEFDFWAKSDSWIY